MKTAFRKPPEWHGDEGTNWGYVNLSHVTHYENESGYIAFVGGNISTIAEPQREEMAKALEAWDMGMRLVSDLEAAKDG